MTSLVVRSGVLSLALLVCAVAARGEDSDQRRYYLDLRYEDIASGITKSHDGAGLSAASISIAMSASSSRSMPTM